MYGTSEIYAKAVGAKVKSVATVEDMTGAHLLLEDGRTLTLDLYGDCCSHSFFTDGDQFNELVGSTIWAIDERDGMSDPTIGDVKTVLDENDNAESISWHFLVFTTDKGHVTLDWRNDSNGYYDGEVHPSITEA